MTRHLPMQQNSQEISLLTRLALWASDQKSKKLAAQH